MLSAARRAIPIIVGGSGERRTLKIVAEQADGCNLPSDEHVLSAKIDTLRATAPRSAGIRPRWRSPSSICRSSAPTARTSGCGLRDFVVAHRPPRTQLSTMRARPRATSSAIAGSRIEGGHGLLLARRPDSR